MHAQLITWTLRRRPWRNLLIILSVAMTVAVMVAFFSTRIELSRFLDRADSVPYQRFWAKPLNLAKGYVIYPRSLEKGLKEIPGVQEVITANYFIAESFPDGFRPGVVQGGSDNILKVERDFFPVDDAAMERWPKEKDGAVIGENVAKELNLVVGSKSEIPTPKGKLPFTVSGIAHDSVLMNRMVFHFDYIDQFWGYNGAVNEYRIAIDKHADARPIVDAVNKFLEEKGTFAQLVSERTMMMLIGSRDAGLIPNLLGALGVVLLITTVLAIANTTVISVRERRAELATMRVLGFKNRSIALMIVNESFIICLVGGVLGTAAAWFAMRDGINLGNKVMQSVTATVPGLVAGLAVSLIVPLIGSVVSSWLAVRAPLAEALRDIG